MSMSMVQQRQFWNKQKPYQPPDFDHKTDYYKILDIKPSATAQDVKNAYFKMAQYYHPDREGGKGEYNLNKFQEITNAYSILSKVEKRKRYDTMRKGSADPEIEKQKKEQEMDFNKEFNRMKKKAEDFKQKNPFEQFTKQAQNLNAKTVKEKLKNVFEQAQKKAREYDHQKANQDFKKQTHKTGSMFKEAREEAKRQTEKMRQQFERMQREQQQYQGGSSSSNSSQGFFRNPKLKFLNMETKDDLQKVIKYTFFFFLGIIGLKLLRGPTIDEMEPWNQGPQYGGGAQGGAPSPYGQQRGMPPPGYDGGAPQNPYESYQDPALKRQQVFNQVHPDAQMHYPNPQHYRNYNQGGGGAPPGYNQQQQPAPGLGQMVQARQMQEEQFYARQNNQQQMSPQFQLYQPQNPQNQMPPQQQPPQYQRQMPPQQQQYPQQSYPPQMPPQNQQQMMQQQQQQRYQQQMQQQQQQQRQQQQQMAPQQMGGPQAGSNSPQQHMMMSPMSGLQQLQKMQQQQQQQQSGKSQQVPGSVGSEKTGGEDK